MQTQMHGFISNKNLFFFVHKFDHFMYMWCQMLLLYYMLRWNKKFIDDGIACAKFTQRNKFWEKDCNIDEFLLEILSNDEKFVNKFWRKIHDLRGVQGKSYWNSIYFSQEGSNIWSTICIFSIVSLMVWVDPTG